MATTTYRNVVVEVYGHSIKPVQVRFRKIMNQIGKCTKAGGAVQYKERFDKVGPVHYKGERQIGNVSTTVELGTAAHCIRADIILEWP